MQEYMYYILNAEFQNPGFEPRGSDPQASTPGSNPGVRTPVIQKGGGIAVNSRTDPRRKTRFKIRNYILHALYPASRVGGYIPYSTIPPSPARAAP